MLEQFKGDLAKRRLGENGSAGGVDPAAQQQQQYHQQQYAQQAAHAQYGEQLSLKRARVGSSSDLTGEPYDNIGGPRRACCAVAGGWLAVGR
mgnify:CR=1 FL=1